MSRRTGVVATLCLVLALCFALTGCAESVDKSNYTGNWKLTYGSDENLDAESMKLMDSLGLSVVLTLNEDGTGSLDLFGDNQEVTWEASSNTAGSATVNGNDATMKLENGELTFVDSADGTMTFERAS